MMRSFNKGCRVGVLLFILIFSFNSVSAKNKFKFRKNGNFKIVQLTDTHFKSNSEKSQLVLQMMEKVLDVEKPDLVIFTGDIVTHKPVAEGWGKLVEPLVKRAIPWTITLGNHDHELDVKRKDILSLIKDIPYNVSIEGDESVFGYGNYVIPIQSSVDKKISALIYCMDSNAYTEIKGVGFYDWFRNSQIEWYQKKSSKWTKKNKGQALPALAFFHIPLVEYAEAWTKGDFNPVGVKNEDVGSAKLNSGMFSAMVQQGDVMGTFVGHDHDNDYLSSLYNIALAYGRFSGGDTYGKLENGARVIVLQEGKHQFTSWIRLRSGDKINEVLFEKKNN